jgi:uncharacterized membrane protein
MKAKIFRIVILVFIASVFIKNSSGLFKRYYINNVDFQVKLISSGQAVITETRTYRFFGSFSWADLWIDLSGKCSSAISCPNYEINDISVFDENGVYPADRIITTVNPNRFYLKWFYTARNQTKTFVIRYTVVNAQTDHPDIREFYWQLIGEGWSKSSAKVTADVYFPKPVPSNGVWAFAIFRRSSSLQYFF